MTRIWGCAHGQRDGYPYWADRRTPGLGQTTIAALAAGLLGLGVWAVPAATGVILVLGFQLLFTLAASWRALLVLASRRADPDPPPAPDLPRYTVMAALLDEAEILPQLVARLDALDYPRDRLEGLLLLEAHDTATRTAAAECALPDWLTVLVVPPGGPRTKPSALNAGLSVASGVLLTVYDAEDDPDPLQLREAAARFAADRSGRLATLQAPLRIRPPAQSASPFLDRQFAVEYAALFEVTLPAMARLGFPFPLGGTSNHFSIAALHAVGGWDAHNVTEDADLGRPYAHPLRSWLARRGGPAHDVGSVARSRLRPRSFSRLGHRHHQPVRGCRLDAAFSGFRLHRPGDRRRCSLDQRRDRRPARRRAYVVRDMLMAPAYWSLLTLAFFHALWRLVTEPFAWDKTRHRRDPAVEVAALAEVEAGREAA